MALLVYVCSWGPKTQDPTDTRLFFCSAGLFSHHGKARQTAVLRSQNSRCFVCCSFFNAEEILCLSESSCLYSFYVFIFKPQGRRISWESITCHGWEIRFCAMIQRWRSDKAGCLWVTWRAVYTTKLVRSFFVLSLQSCLIIPLHPMPLVFFFICVSKLH